MQVPLLELELEWEWHKRQRENFNKQFIFFWVSKIAFIYQWISWSLRPSDTLYKKLLSLIVVCNFLSMAVIYISLWIYFKLCLILSGFKWLNFKQLTFEINSVWLTKLFSNSVYFTKRPSAMIYPIINEFHNK